MLRTCEMAIGSFLCVSFPLPLVTHSLCVSILLGFANGDVSLLDIRSGDIAWTRALQTTKINSIQQSPVDDNIIITSGANINGMVCLHDIRMNGKKKGLLIAHKLHTKSINAAYFSGDAKYIISVSQDNYVFCTHDYMNVKPSISRLRHDNHTGRWLSTFKPSFDPKDGNTFLLGSMDRPRKMEIFTINDKTHSLIKVKDCTGDALGSVQSRNCFHPKLNLLAGANSSGKVCVFQETRGN